MIIAVLVERYPELSETFVVSEVEALRRQGHEVRVQARSRAPRPNPEAPQQPPPTFMQDDGRLPRLAAMVWLGLSRPRRVLADMRDRRRWRRHEALVPLRSLAGLAWRLRRGGVAHLHVHFATAIALDGVRLGRLLGLPCSVTAHAYEIYREPRNLAEKLARATFVTSGCDYTVRDLRALLPADQAGNVHRVVMGVDAGAFQRRTPYPGRRTVVAVGRLVEKKGFRDLLDAVALLEADAPVDRLVLVGEGPLRGALEEQRARLGLEARVEMWGARSPGEVREALERADVLAMPCVVAADGDRDSMPVAVKEALAMEVPVVATREVGLPEIVRDDWGRLVAPGNPESLAAGLREVLAQPLEERIRMGRAGRTHMLEACNVDVEAARLTRLIREAVG